MLRLSTRSFHPGWILGSLTLSICSNTILQVGVAPTLPAMQQELGVSPSEITWVLTAALVSAAVGVPIIGRLADMFGKKRALLVVQLVMALGCLIAALSNTLAVLLAGRVLQGLGAGVFPIAFAIVRDEFDVHRRASAIGFLAAMWGPAAAFSFPLAGAIVDVASYRWIFWIGLALSVIALAVAAVVVRESPFTSRSRIDWAGGALLVGGLGSFLIAINQSARWGWSSPETLGLLVLGLGGMALWTRWELRVSSPLTDLRLLRQRGVWSILLPNTLTGFAMFSQFFLIPAFVETPPSAGYGFGASVAEAGLYLVPVGIMMLIVSPISGFLASRGWLVWGLVCGICCSLLSFVNLALMHDNRWSFVLSTCLTGLGGGLTFAAAANLLSTAVPQAQIAEANAMSATLRLIASSVGATVAAMILTSSIPEGATYPTESAYTTTFVLQAFATAGGLAAALMLLRRTRRAPARERVEAVAVTDI